MDYLEQVISALIWTGATQNWMKFNCKVINYPDRRNTCLSLTDRKSSSYNLLTSISYLVHLPNRLFEKYVKRIRAACN